MGGGRVPLQPLRTLDVNQTREPNGRVDPLDVLADPTIPPPPEVPLHLQQMARNFMAPPTQQQVQFQQVMNSRALSGHAQALSAHRDAHFAMMVRGHGPPIPVQIQERQFFPSAQQQAAPPVAPPAQEQAPPAPGQRFRPDAARLKTSHRGNLRRRDREAANRDPGPTIPLTIPNVPAEHRLAVEIEAHQAGTRAFLQNNRAEGTEKAYAPKEREWFQFCETVFGPPLLAEHGKNSVGELPPAVLATLHLVTPDKAYAFIYYHAHRKQYRRGIEAKFKVEDYNRVMTEFGGTNPPQPDHPVDYSQINNYCSSVHSIWDQQFSAKTNSYKWEEIYTKNVRELKTKVQVRAPINKRMRAEEKICQQISPYYYLKYVPKICRYMFSRGAHASKREVFSSLRNSFTFKLTFHSICRGESVERADLSDLLDFVVQGQSDPHPIHILVMQIAIGKVNRDKKLFSRAMRHSDPALCAMGALFLYLWYRLDVCGEWTTSGPPDFSDNLNWFFIKLLIPSTASKPEDYLDAMSLETYASAVQKACRACNCASVHRGHFGRKAGPLLLEFNEVPKSEIEALGNWSQTQQEEAYSSWLPLSAMRLMAGWRKERGTVFCKRQTKPSSPATERLKLLIFPWLEDARRTVDGNPDRITAHRFLDMMEHGRDILLQDAAVLLDTENQIPHRVFEHDIFRSVDFADYCAEMKLHLETGQEPVDQAMEQCLPGVNARLDGIVHQVGGLESRVTQGLATMNTTLRTQHLITEQMINNCIATAARNFASSFSRDQAEAFASSIAPAQTQDRRTDFLTDPSAGDDVTNDGAGDRRSNSVVLPRGVDPIYTITHSTRMLRSFQSIKQMNDQWTGQDNFEGVPVVGGFAELERVRRSTWRVGYENSEAQRFSKIKRIMNALSELAKDQPLPEVLQKFEQLWNVNPNVTKMATALQNSGFIKKDSRPNKRQKLMPT